MQCLSILKELSSRSLYSVTTFENLESSICEGGGTLNKPPATALISKVSMAAEADLCRMNGF